MDEEKLMIFLQKILQIKSYVKINGALKQLKEILAEQKVSPQLISLIDMVRESLPESKEAAAAQHISRRDILIAKDRADARKRREAEMYSYRGCR